MKHTEDRTHLVTHYELRKDSTQVSYETIKKTEISMWKILLCDTRILGKLM
jgi:hypothetical protein